MLFYSSEEFVKKNASISFSKVGFLMTILIKKKMITQSFNQSFKI